MSELKKIFSKAKNANWKKATVCFYVVKRTLSNRRAKYRILEVDIDEALAKKLRSTAFNALKKSNQATDYDYNTADQDEDFLAIDSSETDFHKVLESINSEDVVEKVKKYEELLGSWAYIAKLEIDGSEPLYSVRRVSDSWGAKKVKSMANVIFKENMLIDLKDEEIFRIDSLIDFFAFEQKIFIVHKKNFETVMNFREGMIKNRDEIVEELKTNKIFSDANKLGELVGDNMKLLRKLSQVKKAGYYKDSKFLASLKEVSKAENWGIKYCETGEIDIDENDIDVILTLLNNGRLTSKINGESFDTDAKRSIAIKK